MAGPAQVAPHRSFERQLVTSLDRCLDWQRQGLAPPAAVTAATARVEKICRSCSQSSSSSTHRLPGCSASKPRRRCSPAPTRSSNEETYILEASAAKLGTEPNAHSLSRAATLPTLGSG